MDRMLRTLRESPPAVGEERVYFAGQKEFEAEAACQREGVPLLQQTYDRLNEVGVRYGIPLPAPLP
jgi:LDH2 family malate/lactate/ureidoglycolate dehydrogenase